MTVSEAKMGEKGIIKQRWQVNFFDMILILGLIRDKVKTDRQMDRQTNSLTPFTALCGFVLQVKFATSLLALLAGE